MLRFCVGRRIFGWLRAILKLLYSYNNWLSWSMCVCVCVCVCGVCVVFVCEVFLRTPPIVVRGICNVQEFQDSYSSLILILVCQSHFKNVLNNN